MAQELAVEWIIRPTVFEFFFEAAADLNAIFGRDGHITAVEKAVEIAPQKEAIVHRMGTAFVKRLDMGGFKGRQGMFLCYRTCAVVGIGY